MKFLPLTIFSVLSSSLSHLVAGEAGEEPECTHGKLYISSRNSTDVHIYDLNGSLQGMSNERNVTLPPFSTNELSFRASSDSEYVAVLYRGTLDVGFSNGVVNWIHTGFFKEDHDDHYHLIYGPPTLVTNSAFSCARASHFSNHDKKIAIFCDGSYDFVPQVNSTVWVVDEAKLGSDTRAVVHNQTLMGSHHGNAIPVDDNHIMYSLAHPERINRAPNSTSAPSTFQITDYNGMILHSISNTTNKDLHCSGYHGSVAKGNTFALACDANHGGVLIANYNPASQTYSSRALFYPPGFTGHRSATLVSHDKNPYVIGNFANATAAYLMGFELTDTAPMTGSNLLPLAARQCAFSYEKSDGEYILAFFPNGTLSAMTYDKVNSWKVVASLLVVPGMTACTQGAFVPGHVQAFVMQFSTRTLYAINLEKIKSGIMVANATTLPFMPLSAIVVGAPEMYSCSLNPKDVVATIAPVPKPTMAPVRKPTMAPVPKPTMAPISKTTTAPTSKTTMAPISKTTMVPVSKPISKPTMVPVSKPISKPTMVPISKPTMVPISKVTMAPIAGGPPPTTTQRAPCGLFGMSIFCPFTFCGFFGRLFGMCADM